MANIEIESIGLSKKEIKKFVKMPYDLYKGNKGWVAPIIIDQIKFITKGHYHENGVIQPFLAYKDGNLAGRIIAHYDKSYNEFYNDKRGCMGFFECINDKDVSRALFKAAEEWLKKEGMTSLTGPMNFLIYDNGNLHTPKN